MWVLLVVQLVVEVIGGSRRGEKCGCIGWREREGVGRVKGRRGKMSIKRECIFLKVIREKHGIEEQCIFLLRRQRTTYIAYGSAKLGSLLLAQMRFRGSHPTRKYRWISEVSKRALLFARRRGFQWLSTSHRVMQSEKGQSNSSRSQIDNIV